MRKLLDYVHRLTLRAYVALQIFAAQEPVRLRAGLVAALAAAALYVPALSGPGIVEKAATVGVVLLPILVGESARKRVTPTE
ncbi:hypothetical protein [Streptomyces sp. bgisy153]|uniref:hypothetical protein n=1 Tax=Streptomyces sp. bgisy153 TaxID=3413793 RepID=UPI003D750082